MKPHRITVVTDYSMWIMKNGTYTSWKNVTNLPLLVLLSSSSLLASVWCNSPYPLTANRIVTSVIMAFLKPPFLTLRSTSIAVALFWSSNRRLSQYSTTGHLQHRWKTGSLSFTSQQLSLSLFKRKIPITRSTVLAALHFCIATMALDKIS